MKTAARYASLYAVDWVEADFFVTDTKIDGLRVWKFNYETSKIR
jgi:hypothetical protein